MPTLKIHLSPSVHEVLIRECERRDIVLGDLVREAVERIADRLCDGGESYIRGSSGEG